MDERDYQWFEIIQRINEGEDPAEPLDKFLIQMSDYFQMGSGFVYQADHTGVLYRNEFCSNYGSDHIPEKIDVKARLGEERYRDLLGNPIIVSPALIELDPESYEVTSFLWEDICKFFGAHSVIAMALKSAEGEIVGIVGFADRREAKGLNEANIEKAIALIGALAGRVKLRRYYSRSKYSQEALGKVLDNLGVDVYVTDYFTQEIIYSNHSMAAPYGGTENLIGHTCWKTLYDDKTGPCDFCPKQKLIDEMGRPTKQYSWDYQRPFDKSWFRVLSAAFRWTDGRLAHVVTSVDITENKKNEEVIRRMAEMDMLTAMPNRQKLIIDIEDFLDELDTGKKGYLIYFDLDGFKNINDTKGHSAGDLMLIEVGNFLATLTDLGAHSYRLGGDEFIIWGEDDEKHTKLKEIVKRMEEKFSQSWSLGKYGETMCGQSAGVAFLPEDGKNVDDILDNGDKAMYTAKGMGKGRFCAYNQGKPVLLEEYLKVSKK